MAKNSQKGGEFSFPGNPAVVGLSSRRPVALRPRLSNGFAFVVAIIVAADLAFCNLFLAL